MTGHTTRTLAEIAKQANVLKIMGEQRCRMVKIDYVPAREAIMLPRLPEDDAIEPYPPTVEELTYFLDDALLGGTVFVVLVCQGKIVVSPFVWSDYDALTKVTINIPPA